MIDVYESQLREYATRGVLVDSNILLLYVVGKFDRRLVGSWKRLRTFAQSDFDILTRVLGLFSKIATTPNILTEVNSFANQLAENLRRRFLESLTVEIEVIDERYVPSHDLAADAHFSRFGLTDIGIVHAARNRFLVLTDDLRLWDFLARNNVAAFNFNHLRDIT